MLLLPGARSQCPHCPAPAASDPALHPQPWPSLSTTSHSLKEDSIQKVKVMACTWAGPGLGSPLSHDVFQDQRLFQERGMASGEGTGCQGKGWHALPLCSRKSGVSREKAEFPRIKVLHLSLEDNQLLSSLALWGILRVSTIYTGHTWELSFLYSFLGAHTVEGGISSICRQ